MQGWAHSLQCLQRLVTQVGMKLCVGKEKKFVVTMLNNYDGRMMRV
jgi:hypothetical protein